MYKEIAPFLQLLNGWEQRKYDDECSHQIELKRCNYTLVFEEDLREHKINFTILHPTKRVLKIYFRTCVYADETLQINELLSDLKEIGDSTNEKEELKAYFKFLQVNGFINNEYN